MKRFRTVVLTLVAAAAFAVPNRGPAAACDDGHEEQCHEFDATWEGAVLPDFGWASEMFTFFGGPIDGGGRLKEMVAVMAFPEYVADQTAIAFDFTVYFYSKHGDILFASAPVARVDVEMGEFVAEAEVTWGAGKFEGATGALSIHGWMSVDGTLVFDEIRGNVCRPHP